MTNQSPTAIINPRYKNKIITCFKAFFQQEQKELLKINYWGNDICNKLSSFSIRGKLIRGCLVCFTIEAYSHKLSQTAIKTAAAVELFHSSLLIHDDIIDNDSHRRGQKTIYEQYNSLQSNIQNKNGEFGKQMGICAGDIGFFWAMRLLQEINNTKIATLCVNELIKVGIAQMQDIYFGYIQKPIKRKEIENVYLYKTARYSFSLPFILGGIISKISKSEMEKLENLGEMMGLLFQIKDDELNIFGDLTASGKPVGSDIRENKKTFYYYWLFQKVNSIEKLKLLQIFGNKHMTLDDFSYVKKLIDSYKIQNIIIDKIDILNKRIQNNISHLSMSNEYKNGLLQLLQFIIERNG
jgi:geranylgeranyl diphosphate synthase, type I